MESTGEAERQEVRVRSEEAGPAVHTLTVEVDGTRVRRAFEKAYRSLARRARIPGFRPGKAPRAVLERMYGPAVAEDVERSLVAETLPQAVQESGLRPVTEPQVDARAPTPDAAFHYTARIEVKPRITLTDIKGLPGRRPAVEVNDADVLGELEALRQRNASLLEEAEGTPAASGHVLRVDFEGRVDGKPFPGGKGENVSVELGSDRFIPGFAEQLEGAAAGEEREVRVTFPEDHGDAAVAGREAVFRVAVGAVLRRSVPELDDEFAKDLGEFDSLDQLRTRVRQDLLVQREQAAKEALRRSVVDALIERTSFEVPPGLIERRLQRLLANAHRQLEGALPDQALHGQLAQWQEEWRPRAEREVREALLLEAVAEREQVEVPDEAVEVRIEAMAREQKVDPARLRKAYREQELTEALRLQLRDEQALDFLCNEAKIEEYSGT